MYKKQFMSREAAGIELFRTLQATLGSNAEQVRVLAMPEGGAPVAAEVARGFNAPLYPLAVRRLGVPGHDNLAMGALAPGGKQWLDRGFISRLGIAEGAVRRVVERESRALEKLRGSDSRHFDGVCGCTALIVGDGVPDNAYEMLAAVEFARGLYPGRLLVAAPVISTEAVVSLRSVCSNLVCLHSPDRFIAADYWYAQQRAQAVRD